jgi:short-subunit dehydrogenase/uncharacterized protein YbjT (DUF2867 family)
VNLLVIGGNSFIGRNILSNFRDSELSSIFSRVTVVSRNKLINGDLIDGNNFVSLNHDFDLSRKPELDYREFDVILYLIADVSFFGGKRTYLRNIEPFRNFMSGIPKDYTGRIVFISSLGALDRSRQDNVASPLNEESPNHPTSFYGKAKLDAENLLRCSGYRYLILRLPWCYGNQMNSSHHLIRLLRASQSYNPIFRINWPGRISTLSVSNLILALNNLLSEDLSNRIVHIHDPNPITFGELFKKMGEIHGKKRGNLEIPRVFLKFLDYSAGCVPFIGRCLYKGALHTESNSLDLWSAKSKIRPSEFMVSLSEVNQRNKLPVNRSRMVITGAANGLGKAMAIQLASLGHSLHLVDRDPSIQELSLMLGSTYTCIELKLANINELVSAITNQMGKPDILINNAGLLILDNQLDSTEAELQKVFDVNVLVPVLLTKKLLLANENLRIINICSSSIYQYLPKYSTYSATKIALTLWSENMRSLLKNSQVLTVVPGGMRTSFNHNNLKSKQLGMMEPTVVARIIIELISKKKSRYYNIGLRARILSVLYRILPKRVLRAIGTLSVDKI